MTARRMGRVLQGIGGFGVVTGIAIIVVGWILAGTTVGAVEEGLQWSGATLETVGDSIDLAATTIDAVEDSLFTMEEAIGGLAIAVGESDTVVAEVAAILSEDLPDSIEVARKAMPGVVAGAQVIDTTMRGLRFFGVDYNPEIPFPDAVRELDAALADIPADLRRQGSVLGTFSTDVESLVTDLGILKGDLAELRLELFSASALEQDYRRALAEAGILVDESRADLVAQTGWLRALAILLGMAFIALQAVPFYLGSQLVRGRLLPDAGPDPAG
jgi:hypothetical protein